MNHTNIHKRFFLKQLKKDSYHCTVNDDICIKAVFREVSDYMQSRDLKKMFTEYNAMQGDIISCDNNNYIVVEKTENINKEVYNTYIILKTNISFKLNFKGTVKEFIGFADSNKLDIMTESFANFLDNHINILMKVPKELIEVDMRMIKWNNGWKITGLDYTKEGLLRLTIKSDSYNKYKDDMQNEIANRWDYEKKDKDKPTEPTKPIIINPTHDQIEVKPIVKPIAPDKITYKLTNNMGLQIHKYNTNTFVAHKYNNDSEVSTNFDFEIDYKNLDKNKFKITNVGSNTIKIQNKGYNKNESIIIIVKDENKEVLRQEIILK